MAQDKNFDDVNVNLLGVEPKDLSNLSLGAEEDGYLYRHDGSSSITTESGSTSEAGFYAWDNDNSQFSNVGGLDETIAASWQAEHTFQAGLLVEDDIRSSALNGDAIWDHSAAHIRQQVLENDTVQLNAGTHLGYTTGDNTIALGETAEIAVTDDEITINSGNALTGGGAVTLGGSLTLDVDGSSITQLDGEAAENYKTRQANIPLTTIPNGDRAAGLRKRVPSGKTLRVFEAGVIDTNGNAPSGLTIEARDITNATDVYTASATHDEGSPLSSKSGSFTVEFRVVNSTGGEVDASGYILYTME